MPSMNEEQRGSPNDEYILGLVKAGDREAHICSVEIISGGQRLSLCGKGLALWPLEEGARVRIHQVCKDYATASRMAASSSYA